MAKQAQLRTTQMSGGPIRELTWRLRLKALRKRFYEHLPYIKRKTYRRLRDEFTNLSAILLDAHRSLATNAKWHELAPCSRTQVTEACLFVSFAARPTLKPHVLDHIKALLDEGIAVTLIVNTDVLPHSMDIPASLLERLNGCFVRENLGFDFAAWAHAFCTLLPTAFCKRLYLVNDSIVGPLDCAEFHRVIADVRQASADLVGLTENVKPRSHLQSFFLVFNERLLHSTVLTDFMRGVLNLPTKQLVIDCYETRLTQFLRDGGYRCEALFPNVSGHLGFDDETTRNWKELRERGFPFIKASVLNRFRDDPELTQLIPARYSGS